MAGVTKHIYDHEIRDIISMWDNELKSIQGLLPKVYSANDVISMLKYYYPHEWYSVEMKYWYYNRKDRALEKRFGKKRYNMKKPEKLLCCSKIYREILSDNRRKRYAASFSEEKVEELKQQLWDKRKKRIERIDKKIEKAKSHTQQITPEFADKLIGLYERTDTSQKDKMYIILELQKYYSFKIMQFFFKVNDTELNKQLRWIAFYHLQSFNYQPRARKQKYIQVHTKNRKRRKYLKEIYPDQRYEIPYNPSELVYRINNSNEQKIKSYDLFISHSFKDSDSVQKLIEYQNQNGKNVFCDWISDSDYLKRNLLCIDTLKVIEKRLEQSECLLFVESNYSRKSIWCKYELNYFMELGKPMYSVTIDSVNNGEYVIKPLLGNWFYDANYKELALLEGSQILP